MNAPQKGAILDLHWEYILPQKGSDTIITPKTECPWFQRLYPQIGVKITPNFWGAEGAPILFSDLGLRMASCSYIYIYIFLSFCKWRRSRRSLQSFKSSLMMFRRV